MTARLFLLISFSFAVLAICSPAVAQPYELVWVSQPQASEICFAAAGPDGIPSPPLCDFFADYSSTGTRLACTTENYAGCTLTFATALPTFLIKSVSGITRDIPVGVAFSAKGLQPQWAFTIHTPTAPSANGIGPREGALNVMLPTDTPLNMFAFVHTPTPTVPDEFSRRADLTLTFSFQIEPTLLPDLTIKSTLIGDRVLPGRLVRSTLLLWVSNNGPVGTSPNHVLVTEVVPPHLRVSQVLASQGLCQFQHFVQATPTTLACDLGPMEANSRALIQIQLQTPPAPCPDPAVFEVRSIASVDPNGEIDEINNFNNTDHSDHHVEVCVPILIPIPVPGGPPIGIPPRPIGR